MLNRILRVLRASGVHAWELSDERQSGWEFYLIRHALDQNRAKELRHITVKVFQLVDGGESMGSASAEIPPTASDAELEKLVADLAYRATLVKNKPYPLNPAVTAAAGGEGADLAKIAGDFIGAVRSLPETATEDVNSYEIFVSDVTRRFLNSEGVDVTERYPASMAEVVINARRDGHEIELYRSYTGGSCDAAGLRADLLRAMAYGRDRLLCGPTPALGKTDVLFSGRDARAIYEYFADRLGAQMIYRKMSDWVIGKPIAGDVQGDRVTLTALRTLPNSSRNRRFDEEGAPIRDVVLLRENVPERYLGSRMFSHYLGLNDSFIPGNFAVSGGSRSEQELRQGRYLEAVEFSDFQVDPMTGDIFGEIRLAYWHDGDSVRPVTGGSLSGSMDDFVRTMTMSEAVAQFDNMRIPALTRLKGVTVTGAGEE